MATLVGYVSSDEDDDIQPEKPAKIPKLDATELHQTEEVIGAETTIISRNDVQQPQPTSDPLGPAAPPASDTANTPSSPPLSPYTSERQLLHNLTMPTHPNFSIPSSPPPFPPTAAHLSATTAKFSRFLELKKQGVHFNERLLNSKALRNPGLLENLMEFAGINLEESYACALPREFAVPGKWGEGCYVEGLLRQSEGREKKRVGVRDKVDFVPAAVGKKVGSSGKGTPIVDGGRKSKLDQR